MQAIRIAQCGLSRQLLVSANSGARPEGPTWVKSDSGGYDEALLKVTADFLKMWRW